MTEKIPEFPKSKSLSDVGADHPKEGDVVGARTIISVRDKFIIFGQREGDLANCGSYVTDYREWFNYEADVAAGRITVQPIPATA